METLRKRIVTTIDKDGKSTFASDEPVASSEALGLKIQNIWGTGNGVPKVGAGIEPRSVPFPYFPGPGGHRVVICEFPPAVKSCEESDPEVEEEASAAAERNQPGLQDVFDPNNPGFHTTDTVDYGFCLDGELWLVLDDGQERHITPGTVVVQRGTYHAWQNRGHKACTMLYVLLGAERV